MERRFSKMEVYITRKLVVDRCVESLEAFYSKIVIFKDALNVLQSNHPLIAKRSVKLFHPSPEQCCMKRYT